MANEPTATEETQVTPAGNISPQATKLVEEFSLAPTDAEQIIVAFSETAILLKDLQPDLEKILATKDITKEVCAEAKALRLKYVKVRTQSVDDTHKKVKAATLLRAKAIDGMKNLFLLQLSEKENPLMDIEKHFERIEEEKKATLVKARSEMMEKIGASFFDTNLLGEMTTEIWDSFYAEEKLKSDAVKEKIENDAAEEVKRVAKEALKKKRQDHVYENGLREFIGEDWGAISTMSDDMWDVVIKTASSEKKKKDDKAKQIIKDNKKLSNAKKKSDDAADLAKANAVKSISKSRKDQAEHLGITDLIATGLLEGDKIGEITEEAWQSQITDAKSRKKEAEERATKNKEYAAWLTENSVTPLLIETGEIKIERDGDKFTMYKRISYTFIK